MRPQEIERSLTGKFGFSSVRRHSDHRYFELALGGLPVVRTKVSHNRKEIRGVVEGKIARQLGVNAHILKRMVGCSESRDEYYARLRSHRGEND